MIYKLLCFISPKYKARKEQEIKDLNTKIMADFLNELREDEPQEFDRVGRMILSRELDALMQPEQGDSK